MAGGGGGNSTTRVDLPKWQRPYVEQGFEGAKNIYEQGGTQVAPFNDYQNRGFETVSRLAGNNQLSGAASGLATNTLNGGFLNSNPYLDATFNRAALQTQNQLASEFAGSGRNVEASQGLRSQQLNDLATGIYGGNYAQERQNQMATLGMSPGLNQAQYTDANALFGVGGQMQQQNQAELDQPSASLDRYLQQVSGSYGNVTQQPMQGNRMGSALGGAMLGSQIGGQYGGNGGMWGALMGGLGGYFL